MHISFFYLVSFALAPIMALPTPSEGGIPDDFYDQFLKDLANHQGRHGSQTPQVVDSRPGGTPLGYGAQNFHGSGLTPADLSRAQLQAGQPSNTPPLPYPYMQLPHYVPQQQGVPANYGQGMSLPSNWQTQPSGLPHSLQYNRSDSKQPMGFHPYRRTSPPSMPPSGKRPVTPSRQTQQVGGDGGSVRGHGQLPPQVTTPTFVPWKPESEVLVPSGGNSKRPPKVRDPGNRSERQSQYQTTEPHKIRLNDIWFEIIWPNFWHCKRKGPVIEEELSLLTCYDKDWMAWKFKNGPCNQRFGAEKPIASKLNENRVMMEVVLCYIWNGDVLGSSMEQLAAIYHGSQTAMRIAS